MCRGGGELRVPPTLSSYITVQYHHPTHIHTRKHTPLYAEVVESTEFPDFEEFMAKVQALWDAQWERVHSASPAGEPFLALPISLRCFAGVCCVVWRCMRMSGSHACVPCVLAG